MSNKQIYGVNNFFSQEDIFINDVGLQRFGEKDIINVIRKDGRQDYHILFMKNGNCTFEYANKTRTLNPGELILYSPYEPQEYFWGTTYSESYWIHFSGRNISELLNSCSLKSGTYVCKNPKKIYTYFDDLIKYYNQYEKSNNKKLLKLRMKSLLICLLCEISDSVNQTSSKTTIISQTLEYIHNNFNEKLSFATIAKNNGINEPRLIQIFRHATGLSPLKYQKIYRIKKAEYLLLNTDMNITTIAQNVGFEDQLYFSRIFSQTMNLPPSEYRKTYKKAIDVDTTPPAIISKTKWD